MTDWEIIEGDCVEAMRAMDEASVDAVVCDPPYGLEFMGKDWDGPKGFRRALNAADAGRDSVFGRTSRTSPESTAALVAKARAASATTVDPASVGGTQDGAGGNAYSRSRVRTDTLRHGGDTAAANRMFQAWCEAWAREALRVLKPGGHLLAFGGTRTYHRLAAGLEDAGFEIRDTIAWLYGSGFPKSLDVSKAIDAQAGAVREVVGPSARHGGGIVGNGSSYELPPEPHMVTAPATPDAARWQGWGTALKPAHEPIVVARKPLAGTVAANVLAHGTGALNIDATRIGNGGQGKWAEPRGGIWTTDSEATSELESNTLGRWPANVVLDQHWTAVLRLRDNLSDDVDELLGEWIRARSRAVPAMRSGHRRPAEPSEAQEVLRSGVLVGMVERAQPRRGASDARPAPLAGVDSEDERVPEGDGPHRGAIADVEGRSVQVPRLLDGFALNPLDQRLGPRRADGAEGARLPAGAPPCHGSGAGSAAGAERSGASPERDQDGQPTGESRDTRHAHAPDDARSVVSRTARIAGAGREVLLRDVPAHWLRFFEFTGDVADVGAAAMLDEQTGESKSPAPYVRATTADSGIYGDGAGMKPAGHEQDGYGDSGGASRFFYVAKASSAERNAGLDGFEVQEVFKGSLPDNPKCEACGCRRVESFGVPTCECAEPQWAPNRDQGKQNFHPTVKPIDLMRWLVRLVTPSEGRVLDPFCGSGTTGIACALEGFDFVGIEREPEYAEIARARIAWWAKRGVGISVEAALRAGGYADVVEQAGQGSLFGDAT